MNRKEFLTLLGMGALGAAAVASLPGCSKSDGTTTPSTSTNTNKTDFTIDLSDSANAALVATGGYIYKSGIIIAHLGNGSYVAVSDVCTHEGATLGFNGSTAFTCSRHGSQFNSDGSVKNGPATTALVKYNTQLAGTSLRIYA